MGEGHRENGQINKQDRKGAAVPENIKEVLEICKKADSFIADELAESIIYGTSYDTIAARTEALPCSRSQFYRKKQLAKDLIRQLPKEA